MKQRFAMLLVLSISLCAVLTGCGGEKESKDMVYAVEAGSAGEAVAQEKGFQINSVASQADALMDRPFDGRRHDWRRHQLSGSGTYG